MLYSLLILTAVVSPSLAWTNHRSPLSIALVGRSSIPLYALLPADYQQLGNNIILEAGRQCGATKDQLKIEWKSGRIVVTVEGEVYVSNSDSSSEQVEATFDTNEEEEDEDEEYSGSEEDSNEEVYDEEEEAYKVEEEYDQDDIVSQSDVNSEDNTVVVDDEISPEGDNDTTPNTEGMQPRGVDVAALARAINAALDDGGVGLAIAEEHEIEVTTPGASDELQGPIMFKAYKGFDVLVTFMDPKKKVAKTIEGKLHDRTSEFTIINIKGRMKKLKNQMLVSVKLPKALKEKGAR
jgi:ribosome maturation factor RimP